jgi:hypothetical protein
MPKNIVNNKIIYQNVYGLTAKHESFLSQGVREGDSPIFNSLTLNGDATVRGNLFVEGNTTLLNTNVIEFEDNIILLNRLESGSGVTLNQSGIEISRGISENYRMVFNESDDTFRIGFISNLNPVVIREESPLENGIMMWNDTTKRIDSRKDISIDISYTSTKNASSATSGSVILSGGLGIEKDIWSNGKLYLRGTSHSNKSIVWTDTSNSLNLASDGDIYISPTDNVIIPYDKGVVFGETTQRMYSDSTTKNIVVDSSGHFDFNLIAGKKVRISNQIPITFSTPSEQIYADSSNNMMIESSEDINLVPGVNRKVNIPLNTGLTFSNDNQQISANLSNDLTLIAGNNIILNPGPTLNIKLPTDNGIKFGNSGNQRIVSDSSDDLYISSDSNIYLNANGSVNIPNNVKIAFGNASKYIRSTVDGLEMNSDNGNVNIINSTVSVNNTSNSTNASTGCVTLSGGIGVAKTIYTEQSVKVYSDDTSSFKITRNTDDQDIFAVDSSANSNIKIFGGNGSSVSTVEITPDSPIDAKSSIQLKSQFDNTSGYKIGRGYNGLNNGRSFTINIPSYTDYGSSGNKPKFSIMTNDCTEELFSIETDTGNIFSKGGFGLTGTQDAENASTASFVVSGGLGVVKSLFIGGDYRSKTDSATAVDIKNSADVSVFRVDTQNKITGLSGNFNINDTAFVVDQASKNVSNTMTNNFTNTTDTTDISNGAVVIAGGIAVGKSLRVAEIAYFNTIDMSNTRITNVQTPVDLKDCATKEYVDLIKQGLLVKDSVQIATVANENLNIGYNTGAVVDGYTLQTGDRILIKNQDDSRENGIYQVEDVGLPTRSLDFSNGGNASGAFVFVINGNTNGGLGWICNSPNNMDTIGTDNITFTQFTALGKVEAGDGLTKTFNRLDVNVDDISLEISSDQLRIKNTGLGIGMTGGSGSPIETSPDQSHVTKLGTINTGIWQASSIQVPYGGTGVNRFTQGNILFGNGLNPIGTNSKFYYDNTNTRLGLGTNSPTANLHIAHSSNVSILLNADSEGITSSAKPEIIFSYINDVKSYIGLSRGQNEYASNIYEESLVISHDKLNTTSVIQFATQRQNRMTILSNGNVGINTSNPSARLHVVGTCITTGVNEFRSNTDSTNVSNGSVVISGGVGISKSANIGGRLRIYNTTPTTSLNEGAVIIDGGLSVKSNQNATNVGNGGALNVAGGASINGDLYVGGSINGSGSSSSTYAYLTLTATDESVNFSTGSLMTFGGITIQSATNATSLTSGGTILSEGGASFGADVYIGGDNYFYGTTNYYGEDDILVFYDNNVKRRYDINRSSTNNFSLNRYDVDETFIERTFEIDNATGSIKFYNNNSSLSSTYASMILTGGLSINATSDATNISNGGGLSIRGGLSVVKNVFIGGDAHITSTTSSALIVEGGVNIYKDATINGSLTTDSTFNYSGNGSLLHLENTSGSTLWHYFGQINDSSTLSYCEIDFCNGSNVYGLKVIVSVNNATCNVSHNYYGTSTFDNINNIQVFIYKDNATGFHLFTKTPSSSSTNINIVGKIGNRFYVVSEGSGTEPDGSTSSYAGSWTFIYKTSQESNLNYTFGDVTIEGLHFNVADNFPVIGYNNKNATNTRDLGIAFQRYQSSNDAGTGELVTDDYILFDSIPNQSTVTSSQIKFSNSLSAIDEYYTGWWIKVGSGANINQVRKVVSYNGSQRVATVDSTWTSQNPSNGDTVYFYNSQYVSFYYNDASKSFETVYNTRDPITKAITSYDHVDLTTNRIILSSTESSINVSNGSLITRGGLSIRNTANSSSSTSGGSITTLGGVGIGKCLIVGDNIAIGTDGFTPTESLHIKQTKSSIVLENSGSVSYIDFAKSGDQTRYGILSEDNLFSLTLSTSGSTPDSSNKIVSLNNTGYVGINTTSNINSPLTLQSGNFISVDGNDSYVGLLGGSGNVNDTSSSGRLVLYGNSATGSVGNVVISSGTSGSVSICTNDDTKRVNIDKTGTVHILTTTTSKSRTSGSLVLSGGVAVGSTENSNSFTSGGALTVAGGASFMKDIFVGGNIYVTGNLVATGSTVAPDITFVNELNCNLTGYDTNKLITIGQEAIFSFAVWVTPNNASENCQIEFELPGKDNGFANRRELIGTCTGYTDDDEMIPLFNVLCVGVKNESRGLIKFQSVSTGIHYFTVICRYTLD